jgi:putative cardiolipin synthase
MLEQGVEIYELSAVHGRHLRESARDKAFGLHTKCVVFDRDTVFLGSLNFDPRSETTNTEVGVVVRSPELAEEILDQFELAKKRALYRLRLDDAGELSWSALEWDVGAHVLHTEPGTSWWDRVKLRLLWPLVPERLL